MHRLSLLVLVLSVVSAAPSHGRSWKVRQDGSGDFTTIQAAINAASHGDSVFASPGTYVENVTFAGKTLVVLSEAGPGHTTIDGSAQTRGPDNATTVYMYSFAPPYPTLRGFTITGGRGTGAGYSIGGGIFLNSGGEIVDCWITLNEAYYGAGIAIVTGGPEATVRSCRIYVNNANYYGGGLYCDGGTLLVDSVISENHSTYPSGGAGMYLVGPWPQTVQNCTIAANNGVGISNLDSYDGSPRIVRCVVAYSIHRELLCGPPLQLECNVIYNANGDHGICGIDLGGNEIVDPLFCDVVSNDFSLTAASPCLPEHSACGVLIGALPQGCGPIGVDAESWASIKARYSER